MTVTVPGPGGQVREVRVTSPDRVLWPDSGITKGELAQYVAAVGPALLRALAGRPVTLQRFPTGIEGEAFYSKNPPQGVPDWVRTVMCRYPSGRRHAQLVVDEIGAAVWAVQMNTVTFHPWPVRGMGSPALDNPDELRIDLDPQPGRGFADAVEAALALRDLMAEVGLVAYAKTSGNRGGPRLRPDRADPRVPRRAARGDRDRPRAGAPAARPRHHRLVEGGAGGEGLRRLQPGLPGPDHRGRL